MRDLAGVVEPRFIRPVLTVRRAGDGSLDCVGDAVSEVDAEVHLDAWESTCALDVADVSLSTEFRLDRLASIATGLFAILLGWLAGGLVSMEKRSDSAHKQWNHVYGVVPRNSTKWGISSEK